MQISKVVLPSSPPLPVADPHHPLPPFESPQQAIQVLSPEDVFIPPHPLPSTLRTEMDEPIYLSDESQRESYRVEHRRWKVEGIELSGGVGGQKREEMLGHFEGAARGAVQSRTLGRMRMRRWSVAVQRRRRSTVELVSKTRRGDHERSHRESG